MSVYVFKNETILRYFIDYVVKKNLLTNVQLFSLRRLCKTWKSYIEYESEEVVNMLKYQLEMREKLTYDKNVYDQYHYKRTVIKNALIPLFPKYRNLKMPFIDSCYTDLDLEDDPDSEKVFFLNETNMPYEFLVFIQEYYQNPTVYVRLYPPDFIQKNILGNKNRLRDIIPINTLYGIIFLVPLCYSKHFKIHYKDKQYISVLCYINVIDKELETDFPDVDERYIVLTINLENLEDNELHYRAVQEYLVDISKSITSDNNQNKIPDYYYPQDIAQHAQSFGKCFDTLIQNQNFNL